MTRRENQRHRRRPFRQPADRILVVSGGVVTEPAYFDGVKRSYRNAAIKIVVKKAGLSPTQLVSYAVVVRDRMRDSFDEVWCVCDVDEFDLTEAVSLAEKSGIRVAVSNPCFELWLLLHFESCRASMGGYEQLRRKLKKHVADYGKGSCADFEKFRIGIPDAIARAKELSPAGEEHRNNPSTGVWALVTKFERD